MDLTYTVFMILAQILIVPFALPIAWAIYYDLSKSVIPPGVDQPLKLRFLHWLMIISSFLGKILENLSICSEIQFIRYTQEGKKLGEDPKLIIQDVTFEDIPVRLYQPRESKVQRKRRGVVFFHGGGWMFGSLNSYDHVCRHIAKESDSVLLSVGYHLAPEQKYPSQFEECLAASVHFMKNAERYGVDPAHVIISGDSVGGNFAASVCQALVSRSDLTPPFAQILIYPGLQAIDFNLPSYQQNRAVPILYREHVIGCALQYLNKDLSVLESVVQGCHVPSDIKQRFGKWINAENIPSEFKVRGFKPHLTTSFSEDVYQVVKQALDTNFSPLMAEEAILCRLPKTCIVTCEYDVLRDDGLLYKKRLEDNGVPVTWYHIEDGFHGVINLFDGFLSFPSGKRGMDRIVTYLKSL
ncbi:arylacetamide deacetylase-like 4 [Tiliqua scincoides]|uniref:arylacetamide deacetylase-like 4 n=1 Tax=Tiliqua scincoides TaxID=71010 RepID=UPI003462266B